MPTPKTISEAARRPVRLDRSRLAQGVGGPVQRDGGDNSAGVIRGYAVITRGEALGHAAWIDADALAQVHAAINAAGETGVKSRFTHPSLSGDGLGSFLGRTKNAVVDGDVVRADLHFAASAHNTPDGDLADYVMRLAEDDPQAFGSSIVFTHDIGAELEFDGQHTDEDGFFKSPDPDNEHNYYHVRIAELHAVDAVDEPAANPGGLFHRQADFVAQAESLLSYSLGLTDERPAGDSLDVDADRVAGFVSRFMSRHNLTISQQDNSMPQRKLNDGDNQMEEQPETDPKDGGDVTPEPEPETQPETDSDTEPEETEPEDDGEEDGLSVARRELARYRKAFGAQGAEWFEQGVPFDAARDRYVAQLEDRNRQLSAANAGLKGEDDELSGGTEADAQPAAHAVLGDGGLGRFAAGIKLPGAQRK